VSRYGCMSLAPTMDKIGVLARTADDCGTVLSVLAGHDPRDRYTVPHGDFRDSAVARNERLRIGWCTNAFPKKVPAAIEAAVRKAVDSLSGANATIAEAELPAGPWDDVAGTIISVEGAAEFEKLLDSGNAAQIEDPLEQIGGYVALQIPASDYLKAQRIRTGLQRQIDALFDRFDVLAAPTFPCPAPPLDANLEEALDYPDPLGAIGNLCGLPAISVPCGFTDEKLPLGLLLVGRALDEHKVLAAARRVQERTDWHRQRPPVG
jgi:aspartyl-tRNA(Asn)/glutamyl-tRNA(Gln) amidotransferase subunit A